MIFGGSGPLNRFGVSANGGTGSSLDAPAGLVELLAADVDRCTDPELIDAVAAMARLLGQTEGRALAVFGAWDAKGLWALDGARSGVSWLANRTELSRTRAAALLGLAREVRARARLSAALHAGVLGIAKVRLLLDARDGLEEPYEQAEAELIEAIRALTVDHARIVLARWRWLTLEALGRNEPDGPVPDAEDRNDFRLSAGLDGRHLGSLNLDDLSAMELRAAIEGHIDAHFQAGTYRADDGLTYGERWARALVDLATNGARAGTHHGRPRPSVAIHWDARDLLDLPGDLPGEAEQRRRELADGTRLPRSTAERLLCDADVIDVLEVLGLDGEIEVLAVGHTNRSADARQRAALERRDGGCAFPGCDLPARWTDAHHVEPWSSCRRSDLANLVLLCRFHHHAVHEGGFRLTLDRRQRVHVTRPDGTAIPEARHGHQVLPAGVGPPAWPPPGSDPDGEPPPTRFLQLTERLWEREQRTTLDVGPPDVDLARLRAAWDRLDLGADPVLEPSGRR